MPNSDDAAMITVSAYHDDVDAEDVKPQYPYDDNSWPNPDANTINKPKIAIGS